MVASLLSYYACLNGINDKWLDRAWTCDVLPNKIPWVKLEKNVSKLTKF